MNTDNNFTNNSIDVVVTWVDGSDKNWRDDKIKYSGQETSYNTVDDREERYRNWDNLKYWFRGIEKHAPWVRKIHFVTYGHIPSWLDINNQKLNIVKHSDFIPQEYLPTFNSNAIEMNLNRIEGISGNFVYFNDDVFIIDDISQEYFFQNGKPCDMLALQPVVANPANPVMSHIYINNSLLLCKYFDKRDNIKHHLGNYFKPGYPLMYFVYNFLELAFPLFTGFYTAHGPAPLCKHTIDELWEKEYEALDITSRNRFRDETDISLYVFREWEKLNNRFVPKNILSDFKYFYISKNNRALIDTIKAHKKKVICINDSGSDFDFEVAKEEINRAFEQIFPDKSTYEL